MENKEWGHSPRMLLPTGVPPLLIACSASSLLSSQGPACENPIMRFRLFRSRAFWFGVPGLVFLAWGWWISMGYFSEAGFWGAYSWGIGQMGGEIYALWDSDGGPEWRSFYAEHQEMTGEQAREVKEDWVLASKWDPSVRYVFIPYHWPALGYVAGWAGLIFWRSRRYRAFAQAE